MINKKSVLALILCLLLAISVIGCGREEPSNDNSFQNDVGNVKNEIDKTAEENSKNKVGKYVKQDESAFSWDDVDGGVAITEYTGTDKAVIVPDTLGGKNVVEISPGAFNAAGIFGIKLPGTLEVVTEKAFYYCTTLLEVHLGDATTTVAAQAFEGCIALETVKMNNGLEEIEKQAFGYCTLLEKIDIPSTTKQIGKGAFCLSGLKSVTIPASVELIGESAFATCSDLGSVKIESGVKTIGYGAFAACDNLKKVEIPASVDTIENRAFSQSENVVIYAPSGSVAETYAAEQGIIFKAS